MDQNINNSTNINGIENELQAELTLEVISEPTPEPTHEPIQELTLEPIQLTLEEKLVKLKKILKDHSYNYDEPKDINMIHKIYDLYINNIIDESIEDGDYYTYLGFYYSVMKNDKFLAKKFYLMAVDKENVHAMYNYALVCDDEDNYSEMKKYFKMAIKLGDVESMASLGYHYYNTDNYDKMKKYYLMAIENGNTEAMIYMGHYYLIDKEKEEKGLKFYELAIEKKNYKAYFELANYYHTKDNYEKCKEYYILYFENSDDEDYILLGISSLISIVIQNEQDINFLIPYVNKYELSMNKINNYKLKLDLRKQFMINKRKFSKKDTCNICFDEEELIIYDCFNHYICEKCYEQYDKCPFCFIEKHQMMINNKKIKENSYSDDDLFDDEVDVDDEIDDELDDDLDDELDDIDVDVEDDLNDGLDDDDADDDDDDDDEEEFVNDINAELDDEENIDEESKDAN